MRTEFASSLAKRAIDVVVNKEGDAPKTVEIPSWGAVLMAVTMIGFAVFWVALSYTLEEVIATLTMVETPLASIRLGDADTDPLNKSNDPTAIPAESKPVPITSGIRSTIRHIVAQGGAFARWRGFRMFVLYSILSTIVNGILGAIIPIPGLNVFLTTILLAPVHAGWTHAVIASPATQQKSFWSRILPRASYKQLLAPSAAFGAAYLVLAYITLGLRVMAVSKQDSHLGEVIAKPMVAICIYILVSLFIVLPAAVTLARIEASLLPEDEDTIVPLDRTFGGKVVPQEYGGTGNLGFLDAWRSFNWEARRRLLKLYVKILLIGISLGILATFTLMAEGAIILGSSEFKKAAHQGLETVRDLKM